MSLRPKKTEVEQMAALLEQGGDSPEELAVEVIKQSFEFMAERITYAVTFELTPGVYQSYGPYPTRAAAEKAMPKLPMAQVANRGVYSMMLGPKVVSGQMAAADVDPKESTRSDFEICREDAQAFRNGWKGEVKHRDRFLNT